MIPQSDAAAYFGYTAAMQFSSAEELHRHPVRGIVMVSHNESKPAAGDFSFPSEISEIGPAVERISEMFKKSGCAADQISDIEIAAFEALGNAVIHGNRQNPDKRVHISCHCEPGKEMSIVVRDEGTGFDPKRVPDPTSAENLESEHGRGILLMRTFMDDVHYEAHGTEVHMTKKLK